MVVLAALLLCAEIARSFVGSALAENNPGLASEVAPRAPEVINNIAMGQVGQAAARGENPSGATMARFKTLAAIAPMRPEPFQVDAAIALKTGDFARAEQLLREARWRDPRSPATRYLLAEVWLRKGYITAGLGELATLSRLFPAASVQLVPALAEFARTEGADRRLSTVLQRNPQLRRPLLNALAADPDNAELILAIAGPDSQSADPQAMRWKARLLGAFVARGRFAEAYDLWRRFADLPERASPLLFNGNFQDSTAPPPFNWSYVSGRNGVAEPAGGRLRVLFYGREETVLASQLLLLSPGAYSFEAPVSAAQGEGALEWLLSCVSTGKAIAAMRADASQPAVRFEIPAECLAQTLVLRGHAQDMPQTSDVLIGPVRIERTGI